MVSGILCREQFKARECGVFSQHLSGQGQVVSVYGRAINVLHRSGLVVSLVKSLTQMTSLSIRVPSFFGGSEPVGGDVKPGCRARFEDRRLRLNGLCIDFEGGKTWDGSLCVDDILGFRLSIIPVLREALRRKGKQGGLLGLIHPEEKENPFVQKASAILGETLTKKIGSSRERGLSKLVGLGVGFTPSGDDFISGVLLGERVLNLLSLYRETVSGILEQRIKPYGIDKEDLWKVQNKTTHGGRTLLWQALQGHFPYYLIETARGLATATTIEELIKVVGRAASHGETSGTDALVGLFVYLDWVTSPHSKTR